MTDVVVLHQLTLRSFYIQLQNGCGDDTCLASTCRTYRKKHSVLPFRGWSELSNRAAAFHLASLPNATSLLCHDANNEALLKCEPFAHGSRPHRRTVDLAKLMYDLTLTPAQAM